MKNLMAVMAMVVMASGCATLQSQGVLTADQSKALCVDALTMCAAAGAADVSVDVHKYCAAVAVVCAVAPAAVQ